MVEATALLTRRRGRGLVYDDAGERKRVPRLRLANRSRASKQDATVAIHVSVYRRRRPGPVPNRGPRLAHVIDSQGPQTYRDDDLGKHVERATGIDPA